MDRGCPLWVVFMVAMSTFNSRSLLLLLPHQRRCWPTRSASTRRATPSATEHHPGYLVTYDTTLFLAGVVHGMYERCTARTANANGGVLSGYGRRRRCSADSSRMVAQPVIIALINWAILVSDKSLFCDCEMDSRRLLDDGASVLHRQSFGEFHERL